MCRFYSVPTVLKRILKKTLIVFFENINLFYTRCESQNAFVSQTKKNCSFLIEHPSCKVYHAITLSLNLSII